MFLTGSITLGSYGKFLNNTSKCSFTGHSLDLSSINGLLISEGKTAKIKEAQEEINKLQEENIEKENRTKKRRK